MEMRMVCRLEHRLELRLALQAPTAPNPVTGLAGLQVAHEILRELGAVGMLVGGLAKEIWSGTEDPAVLDSHKDVDVLVLTSDCRRHPGQWRDGVDWWWFHRRTDLPTNGCVPLIIRARLSSPQVHTAGLHLCPRQVLAEWLDQEQRLLDGAKPWGRRLLFQPRIRTYPVLPASGLRWAWPRKIIKDRVAQPCAK